MAANDSNLSDPHYGYDVIVAVTQKSVNATLKQFLAGLDSPDVILCFVYDDQNNIVPIDFATLKANAKGTDPFSIANGADPKTDTGLINLADANFAGAVKARIGLPDAPLDSLPPIVTFGHGASAPVAFNLLCAEFQIVGFQYGARGMANWINMSQPTDPANLWYFSTNVDLNTVDVDPKSPVPPAVQQKIMQLQQNPQNAFTIQKLFLDLDTAILLSNPVIKGLPDGWAVWNLITSIFLGAYIQQLRQTGDPVLSYSIVVKNLRPSTLQLGSIARECLPLMINGQVPSSPSATEQAAAELVYLGSVTTTPPVPVPFGWNWIELADVGNFSGVQAVRRDLFFAFLGQLANRNIGRLCFDPNVTVKGSGTDYEIKFSNPISSAPSVFTPVSPIGTPAADGFTKIFDLSFSRASHGYDWVFGSNVNIDYNYTLAGEIAVSTNQIRVTLHPVIYMAVQHLEVMVTYHDLPGANYYDKTLTILFTLSVDQNGAIQVTGTPNTVDASVPWNLHLKGLIGDMGFTSSMTSFESQVATNLDSTMSDFENQLEAMINGYQGWVFPGNDAFVFKNVAFSTGLDLITQLTYANPN